jgi:pyrroloquinoline-quinone synthase
MQEQSPNLVERIDAEIEKYSLLKHPFYRMWSEGRLTIDHLQGYSKEYFQLVKTVPRLVENISSLAPASYAESAAISDNLKEESEHIELWARFASAIGVQASELANYVGDDAANSAVSDLIDTSRSSFEEGVAAMYAYEAELPRISATKIEGLKNFYSIDSADATNYFEIHKEADIRHAQVWRSILLSVPAEKQGRAFAAAVMSLKAQNRLLDSVQQKYVKMNC